ncbi:MAG TPA: flagellar basal body rod protein FlgC [Desulfuromonadales bacterium]|nr:flagellar basal body rod protein FlgC [Desulfuromonadales bacterium]
MDIFQTMKIGASALQAQQVRLNTISSNLANIDTTHTPEGGPYQKKDVIFEPTTLSFDQSLQGAVQGVQVAGIVPDSAPPRLVYDPNHPDAGPNGYVKMPNVNVVEEVADMISASRAYEANVTTIKSATRMATKALEI